MGALEKLRERNIGDVILKSGVMVGLELLGMRYAFSSGFLPMAAVEEVLKRRPDLADKPSAIAEEMSKNGEAPDWMAAQRAYLAACIRTIDGEEVSLSPDDMAVFTDEEYFELVEYVMRTKPLPGKA